ncbi:MAG: hypothetical protein ACI9KS_002359 [Sulfitobacter sp.]|jgi:hypothetical protein
MGDDLEGMDTKARRARCSSRRGLNIPTLATLIRMVNIRVSGSNMGATQLGFCRKLRLKREFCAI